MGFPKWIYVVQKVTHPSTPFVLNSSQPHGLYSPWNFPGQNTEVSSLSLLQGIFPTRIKPRSLSLQADSLPSEPPGEPKNIGVGSLSLLQRIFLTQESNWGLLHGRWILHQLSYQGSPNSFRQLLGHCDSSFSLQLFVN